MKRWSDNERYDPVKLSFDEIIHETEKSQLFLIGDDEHWLPKSQITVDHVKSIVEVPRWLADKHRLG